MTLGDFADVQEKVREVGHCEVQERLSDGTIILFFELEAENEWDLRGGVEALFHELSASYDLYLEADGTKVIRDDA